jgi:O-antigen ligase
MFRNCSGVPGDRCAHFFSVVLSSRLQTGGSSTSAHFAVYSFIPQVLHMHPLLGLGLNNFSVYYEFVTGQANWGPHSFFVALLVETGLIGTAVYATFICYSFRRIRDARAVGGAASPDRSGGVWGGGLRCRVMSA